MYFAVPQDFFASCGHFLIHFHDCDDSLRLLVRITLGFLFVDFCAFFRSVFSDGIFFASCGQFYAFSRSPPPSRAIRRAGPLYSPRLPAPSAVPAAPFAVTAAIFHSFTRKTDRFGRKEGCIAGKISIGAEKSLTFFLVWIIMKKRRRRRQTRAKTLPREKNSSAERFFGAGGRYSLHSARWEISRVQSGVRRALSGNEAERSANIGGTALTGAL